MQGNLSADKPDSLYHASPCYQGWQYTLRMEVGWTIAEPEMSILSRQCLDRRIPIKRR